MCLGEMWCEVVGVERIRSLAEATRRRLAQMEYTTACIHHADGINGYCPDAPYGGIIVCAECVDIPPYLPTQLASGGRLVLPLRQQNGVRLTAVDSTGAIISRRESVAFVPLKEGTA